MLNARWRVLAAVLTLWLAGAACSGDTIKLDDYRTRVAGLFAAYDRDIAGLSSQLRTSGTEAEVFASVANYASAGVDRTATLLTAWDALAVPERARAVHDDGRQLIEAYRSAFEALKAGGEAKDAGAREAFNQRLEAELPARLQVFQDALNGLQ